MENIIMNKLFFSVNNNRFINYYDTSSDVVYKILNNTKKMYLRSGLCCTKVYLPMRFQN